MKTIVEKIKQIYPQLTDNDFYGEDIVLQNDSDGKGDYIAAWKRADIAQPSQSELDAVQ